MLNAVISADIPAINTTGFMIYSARFVTDDGRILGTNDNCEDEQYLRGGRDGYWQWGVFDGLEGGHDVAGEEMHAFLGEVGREGTELEETEEVADAETLSIFQELVADGGGAADNGVGTVFDVLARSAG